MEGHGPTRRQNEPRRYENSSDRFAPLQDLERGFSDELSGRRRQRVPITGLGPSSQGSAISTYGIYSAQESPFSTASPVDQMSYQAEYAQEPRQQQANYSAFDSNLTYGLNQQPLGGMMYESSQQFNQQQSAPSQALTSANSFYPSESIATQSHSGIYPGPADSIGLPQARQEGTTGPGTSATIDHAYRRCSADLAQIFQNISDGTLAVASQLLLSFSEWLISHVEEMGTSLHQFMVRDLR